MLASGAGLGDGDMMVSGVPVENGSGLVSGQLVGSGVSVASGTWLENGDKMAAHILWGGRHERMCCRVIVMRNDYNTAVPEPAPSYKTVRRRYRSDDGLLLAGVLFGADEDEDEDVSWGHAVDPRRFMLMLKEAIGYATSCEHAGVSVHIAQLSVPCAPHHSSYPFPLEDFCLEALREHAAGEEDTGGT